MLRVFNNNNNLSESCSNYLDGLELLESFNQKKFASLSLFYIHPHSQLRKNRVATVSEVSFHVMHSHVVKRNNREETNPPNAVPNDTQSPQISIIVCYRSHKSKLY